MNVSSIAAVMNIPSSVIARHALSEGLTYSEASERAQELTKFLAVCSRSDDPCVPSRVVDAIWHEFLNHPDEYETYCLRLGKYIHHEPSSATLSSLFQQQYERTRQAIAAEFGSLNSQLWPIGSDGGGIAICRSDCRGNPKPQVVVVSSTRKCTPPL